MRKTLALILAVTFILPLCVSCTTAKEQSAIIPAEGETVLYVSPNGDDTADGTFGKPLATLEGAKAKVRALLPAADGAVSVYFREGDYTMTAGVSFDESDSGREGAPVKYAAYPDEKVRFIGGVKVDPSLIKPADPASSVTARILDETAKAALLQADVSSLTDVYPLIYTYDDTENDSYHPMELYLGDTAVTPARWPNMAERGGTSFVSIGVAEDKPRIYDSETQISTIFYDDDVAARADGWSDESLRDAYLYGYLEFSWISDRYKLLSLDRDAGSVTLSRGANNFSHYTESGKSVFVNLPEEIDVPGESYADRTAKVVYFYPTEDYDANDVWLSTLTDDMLTFNGTAHLAFEGIEFGWTRGAVIQSDGLTDFTMTDCRLVHTSSKAGYFYGAKGIHLDGCEIGDTAHGGLVLLGGDRKTLESADVVIENCDIHHFCRSGFTYSPELLFHTEQYGGTAYGPGMYVGAVGTVIRHNTIHDCIHEAVAIESNDIVIEYNEFYNCVSEASDMGAIYYWNNPTLLGLVIRYNYFHEIGGLARGNQHAIYTDCGSMGPDVYGNLFVDAAGLTPTDNPPSHPKSVILLAQFAHVHDNVFVDAPAIFRYADWSIGGAKTQNDWLLLLYGHSTYGGCTERFYEVDFGNEAWHVKYDGTLWGNLFKYFSFETLEEFNAMDDLKAMQRKAAVLAPKRTNELDGNVIVDVGTIVNEGFLGSLNVHDNYETNDYGIFTDAANGDYTLTDAALAQIRESCPDFEPLPLDEIGPKG